MSETSVSQQAVYRARPTLRLAGQADERASELLIAMCVTEAEGGMSSAELRFSNWASTADGAESGFEDGSRLALGTAIEVYAGEETQPREIFRGVVSALEAEFGQGSPPELTVMAEDPLARARMARRSKVYTDMAPAEVVRQVANALGLRPTVQGLDAPVGTWAQLNESDLAFLRRLLGRFDGDLQVVGDELQVAPRAEVRRGERVEMTFMNPTMMMHPMHLHGHHFQVVAIGGRRFSGAVRDTVIVPPHAPVTIAFDAAQKGAWLLHCHHLYHMATGMMTEVRIA